MTDEKDLTMQDPKIENFDDLTAECEVENLNAEGGIEATEGIGAAFTIRTTCPNGNLNYVTTDAGGWNTCIHGYPEKAGANALANCVGYASGRFNEIINWARGTSGCTYKTLNCNAENFWIRAQAAGLNMGQIPRRGAIMCWEGIGSLAGHVAIVERVNGDGSVYTSESGYGSSTYFWNSTRSNNNGRWGMSSNFSFNYFIYLPADVQRIVDGSEITQPVARDETKNQLEVLTDDLRCRDGASLKAGIYGFVKRGIYDYADTKDADGYTWCRIADEQWVAYAPEWAKLLPKEEPKPEPTPEPVKEHYGIDVSRWQGEINWPQVKEAGVTFTIIKAGGSDAGFYTDRYFEKNYAEAKAAGLPVGAYYYVGPYMLSYTDGVIDAKKFLNIIKGKQFEYPVYIDVEESNFKSHKAECTQGVIGFCETMESAGYYAGIYGSEYNTFQAMVCDDQLQAYDHWVANWSAKPNMTCGMWQKSSSGSIPGISGRVDEDVAFKDYPAIIKAAGLNGYGYKSNYAIAYEVWQGKWGNGQERKDKLTAAGYNYSAIQALVNKGFSYCKAHRND